MIKGINEKEENIIKGILSKYPYEFYYYGSRVKGDFKLGSDLDILLKSEEKLSYAIIEEIETEFNKSRIPYRVNISDFSRMENCFYDLIKNDLVKV